MAYDYANNSSMDSIYTSEDTTPPVVLIEGPEMLEVFDNNQGTVYGSIEDQSNIRYLSIDNEDVNLSYDSSTGRYTFSHTLPELEDGIHQIKVSASDISGNSINLT